MRSKTLVCVLATFSISTFSAAAPKATYSGSQTQEDEAPAQEKNLNDLDVVVTPSPPVPKQKSIREQRYLYKRNLSTRLGIFYDANEAIAYRALGIAYLIPNSQNDERMVTNTELSMDLLFGGDPVLSLLKKWTYQPKEKFRYILRAGGAVRWDAQEQLAAFVNYENYAIHGSAGIEYWIWRGISLKTEVDAMAGTDIIYAGFTFGAVLAW